jgi:hypothetical protein
MHPVISGEKEHQFKRRKGLGEKADKASLIRAQALSGIFIYQRA